MIHPQKQKWSVQTFFFWEHSKGLSNQADVELDMMINAISAADIAFIMSSSQAIAGFHMTSPNFKLQNYWSSWGFTFMMYKSS